MCAFTAELVEHCKGFAKVTVSNPIEALIFFRLLPSNCLNWKFAVMITLHLDNNHNDNTNKINNNNNDGNNNNNCKIDDSKYNFLFCLVLQKESIMMRETKLMAFS